jgi:hypothetical protein
MRWPKTLFDSGASRLIQYGTIYLMLFMSSWLTAGAWFLDQGSPKFSVVHTRLGRQLRTQELGIKDVRIGQPDSRKQIDILAARPSFRPSRPISREEDTVCTEQPLSFPSLHWMSWKFICKAHEPTNHPPSPLLSNIKIPLKIMLIVRTGVDILRARVRSETHVRHG